MGSLEQAPSNHFWETIYRELMKQGMTKEEVDERTLVMTCVLLGANLRTFA